MTSLESRKMGPRVREDDGLGRCAGLGLSLRSSRCATEPLRNKRVGLHNDTKSYIKARNLAQTHTVILANAGTHLQ